MKHAVMGALGALLMVAIGLFWWQGRAEMALAPPLPTAEPAGKANLVDDALLKVDSADLEGPEPPEASELTREQRRFFRYDRNRDWRITRNEMLASRTDGFRKLDVDGNNLLTFEEWAVTTAKRFDEADEDGDLELTPAEFATTRPKPRKQPKCRC